MSGSGFYREIIDKDSVTERGESFRLANGIFKISLPLFSSKLHLSKLHSIISKNLRGAKSDDSISNFLCGISISSLIRLVMKKEKNDVKIFFIIKIVQSLMIMQFMFKCYIQLILKNSIIYHIKITNYAI